MKKAITEYWEVFMKSIRKTDHEFRPAIMFLLWIGGSIPVLISLSIVVGGLVKIIVAIGNAINGNPPESLDM